MNSQGAAPDQPQTVSIRCSINRAVCVRLSDPVRDDPDCLHYTVEADAPGLKARVDGVNAWIWAITVMSGPWRLVTVVSEAGVGLSRVGLFASICRDKRLDPGLSQRALAEKCGVHRRTIKQALESALPAPRKAPKPRATVLEPAKAWIDAMLREDLTAPRKQTPPSLACRRSTRRGLAAARHPTPGPRDGRTASGAPWSEKLWHPSSPMTTWSTGPSSYTNVSGTAGNGRLR
ncbi:DUF6228 family protein [Streptomyces sp. NPDC001530]|uniref:DUF6228 family protein n=1 Tax=Streptomyces sp. NPDC001530 TaxID=3364582 RepID=UPI0036C0AA55